MKKTIIGFGVVALGTGFVSLQAIEPREQATEILPEPQIEAVIETAEAATPSAATVVFPVEGYADHRTFKGFGEYVEDRFVGYHVAEDVEVDDVGVEIPVYAIADGTVTFAGDADGYGGVIIIAHPIDGTTISAIYGHLDMASASVIVGDRISMGQQLAYLGDHESEETDGARKHLHFGMYEGEDVRFSGYVKDAAEVSNWMNPGDFLVAHGLQLQSTARMYDPEHDQGSDVFDIAFEIPAGMDVEYVPSIEALNLYTLSGDGTARERSQIFIRYFDAANFLTLSTVTIYSTEDVTTGSEDYVSRRYDIEKKPEVENFVDQPTWRNERHIVTDFRAEEGFTRYYVVAANPDLNTEIYQALLDGIRITK